jgi:hypothetical protein
MTSRLLATLVDAAVVAAPACSCCARAGAIECPGRAAGGAARLRGGSSTWCGTPSADRALDQTLAMREATLRVLLQTTAPSEEGAAPGVDPAEVRLVRDLELSLERPAHAARPES